MRYKGKSGRMVMQQPGYKYTRVSSKFKIQDLLFDFICMSTAATRPPSLCFVNASIILLCGVFLCHEAAPVVPPTL